MNTYNPNSMAGFKTNQASLVPNIMDMGMFKNLGSGTNSMGMDNYSDMFSQPSKPAWDTSAFGFNGSEGTGGWAPDKGIFDKLGAWAKSSGFLGSTDTNGMKTEGWGGTALGALGGLGSAFMAMKQYGLSKDIFENNKSQFEKNFGAQQKLTNSKLEQQQENKITAARNNGYAEPISVAEYMKKFGV
jgi:hypothetical protein